MFLDRTDKAILRILQQDCSMTNVELAERIALSPPACLKRVHRLINEGVISRQVALVDPGKLGRCLHILVEVIMERDRRDLYKAFMDSVQDVPEVKQCYQVTGEVDFVLIIEVPDMESYEELRDVIFYSHDNVKSFKTLISLNRSKYVTDTVIRD